MSARAHPFRVCVVGGSLAGLAVAAELRRVCGAEIRVYERSTGPLQGRGAGIVMQSEIETLLRIHGIHPSDVTVPLAERRILDHTGAARTARLPQTMTAWDALYRVLLPAIGDADYRMGAPVGDIKQIADQVEVSLGDDVVTANIVIGADGIASTVRNQLVPKAPRYAGYAAWRGLQQEADLPEHLVAELNNRFTLFSTRGQQFLCYLVPGADGHTAPGHRRINWVWYINTAEHHLTAMLTGATGRRYDYFLPAGDVSEDVAAMLESLARTCLPPLLASLVAYSQPFLQPIMDVDANRMWQGRCFLIGDAAGTVRPHTASGTSKSVADAILLARTLAGWDSTLPLPDAALQRWEEARLDALAEIGAAGLASAAASRLGVPGTADVWSIAGLR